MTIEIVITSFNRSVIPSSIQLERSAVFVLLIACRTKVDAPTFLRVLMFYNCLVLFTLAAASPETNDPLFHTRLNINAEKVLHNYQNKL